VRHPKREVWRRILADPIFAYQPVELGKRPAAIRIRQESCSTGCHDPSVKIRHIFPRRWSAFQYHSVGASNLTAETQAERIDIFSPLDRARRAVGI
jgi:hypothetical protein